MKEFVPENGRGENEGREPQLPLERGCHPELHLPVDAHCGHVRKNKAQLKIF